MSSLVLSGDTSGSVTVSVPAVAGTNTVTIPASSGVVMVSGNMPAFSAYGSADQTLATATATKIQYNNETFDTANCYDSTTNYRFTPTVAGYYSVYAFVEFAISASANQKAIFIYKNGSSYRRGQEIAFANNNNQQCAVNAIMYLNGSTDYIEIYCVQNSGINLVVQNGNGSIYNAFEAILVRAA